MRSRRSRRCSALPVAPAQTLEDYPVETLTQKHALLALDNCEHVLGSVSDCEPRRALVFGHRGAGHQPRRTGDRRRKDLDFPLWRPGSRAKTSSDSIHADAISLFVERARQVKADFALSDNNFRAVVDICQRLDGVHLPLNLRRRG